MDNIYEIVYLPFIYLLSCTIKGARSKWNTTHIRARNKNEQQNRTRASVARQNIEQFARFVGEILLVRAEKCCEHLPTKLKFDEKCTIGAKRQSLIGNSSHPMINRIFSKSERLCANLNFASLVDSLRAIGVNP